MSTSIYKKPLIVAKAKLINALWEGTKPGIDGLDVFMKFNPMPFSTGKTITYDFRNGCQIFIRGISGDIVFGTLVTTDPKESYVPEGKLQAGIEWAQLDNSSDGEYSVMG